MWSRGLMAETRMRPSFDFAGKKLFLGGKRFSVVYWTLSASSILTKERWANIREPHLLRSLLPSYTLIEFRFERNRLQNSFEEASWEGTITTLGHTCAPPSSIKQWGMILGYKIGLTNFFVSITVRKSFECPAKVKPMAKKVEIPREEQRS